MEGIIIMVIGLIFSALFKNNKKNEEQKQNPMPPFNNKPQQMFEPRQQQPRKRSLEDFTSEIFEQLNEKANPTIKPELKKEEQPIFIEKVEKPIAPPTSRPKLEENRSLNRNTSGNVRFKSENDPIKNSEIGSFVPTTKNALVQAIIASEIIGPPKAKQR